MTAVNASHDPESISEGEPVTSLSFPQREPEFSAEILRAALAGLLGAGALYAIILLTRPAGPLLVTSAVVLLVVTPTSKRLDRRLAINLALVLGWLPIFGWLPVSAVPGGRMALCIALAGGGVIATANRPTAGGVRSLVPHTKPSDLLIGATGALAGWVAWPLWVASSPLAALSTLMSGWDQASHTSMFLDQRVTGAAPPLRLFAAADSSGFFDHYPQWQHSLMALLAELAAGPVAGSSDQEVLLYAHVQWALFVLLAVFVMATTLQRLPQSGSSVGHILSTATVWSLILGVPGAQCLYLGHVTFLVAGSAAAAIVPLSTASGSTRPVRFAALCGLVVVSASWMLLLPLALTAALPALLSTLKQTQPRTRLLLILLGVPAAASTALLCWVSVGGDNVSALNASGGLMRPTLAAALAIPVSVGLTCWRAGRRQSGARYPVLELAGARRVAGMSLVAAVELGALAAYQLGTKGDLEYYWWKAALGTELILLLSAAPILYGRIAHLSRTGSTHRGRTRAAWWAAMAASALGLGTLAQNPPIPTVAWIASTHAALQSSAAREVPVARTLLLLSAIPTGREPGAIFIDDRPEDQTGANLNQWLHTLTRTRSSNETVQDDALVAHPGHPAEAAAELLKVPGTTIFVSDRETAAQIVAAVPDAAGRVTVVGQ